MSLTQFEHMSVQTETMEYATKVLLAYFSAEPPEVVPCPPGVVPSVAAAFVKRQFIALSEEGVLINELRLFSLLPSYSRYPLLSLPRLYVAPSDSIVRAFIDIEGSSSNPFEIAIIFTYGPCVLETFHAFLHVSQCNQAEKFAVKHIHGLQQRNAKRKPKTVVLTSVNFLLRKYEPSVIFANGMDVVVALGDYQDRLQNFSLPPWQWRPGHYSHSLAKLFKLNLITAPFIPCCDTRNHDRYIGPFKMATTLSQKHKNIHGYHCALADAYELYKFYFSSLDTRRD